MSNKTKLFMSFVALSASAFAVDGVTLINQATVMSAGGFPYTISQPGSYKLSGNLIVPGTVVSGLNITASNVTLDLNGFTISCTCSPGIPIGIDSTGAGTTLFNGTISGFSYVGVLFGAKQASVDRMNFLNNGYGIVGDFDVSASNSTFAGSTNAGLALNSGTNTALMVSNSKFIRNFGWGITAPSTSAAVIVGSVFLDNGNQQGGSSGGITIFAGTVTQSTFSSSQPAINSQLGPVLYSLNSFIGGLPLGSGPISAGNNGCQGLSSGVLC